MQKWYVEDYLTHKCVKNSGERRVFHKTVLEQKWTKMGVLPIRLVKY